MPKTRFIALDFVRSFCIRVSDEEVSFQKAVSMCSLILHILYGALQLALNDLLRYIFNINWHLGQLTCVKWALTSI